jgi:hypothetical protein
VILLSALAVAGVCWYLQPSQTPAATETAAHTMSAAKGGTAKDDAPAAADSSTATSSNSPSAAKEGSPAAAKDSPTTAVKASAPAPSITNGYERVGGDEFNGNVVDSDRWGIYDSPGDSGKGLRRPSQIKESGGAVTVSCTANGTTGGMMYLKAQRYGIWETRVKMSASSRNVRPVLLLWPSEVEWPAGGEVDYMEVSDPSRQDANGYLHYSSKNNHTEANVQIDLTKYNVFAVKWTKDGIFYYVNNHLWFADHDPTHQPPELMQPTIQLDYSGGKAIPGTMTVDWMRIYQ